MSLHSSSPVSDKGYGFGISHWWLRKTKRQSLCLPSLFPNPQRFPVANLIATTDRDCGWPQAVSSNIHCWGAQQGYRLNVVHVNEQQPKNPPKEDS